MLFHFSPAQNLKKCDVFGLEKTRGGYMSLVVKSKVKELTGEFNVSGDFSAALDAKVENLVRDAMRRAEGNGRRTIMAKDL